MRLLYIVLAHNQPEHLFEMADTLVRASTDASVIIHFDGNANASDFTKLQSLVKNNAKIDLVEKRIKCRWGAYSLVESTLGALRQAYSKGGDFDYVILLSGACLPCRPIAELEQFLSENSGCEFIEFNDENWMVGGLRKERYQFYFRNGACKEKNFWQDLMVELQRKLGIVRRVPLNMDVKFGSQWWALTGNTCAKILNLLDKNPQIEKFFRRTYIPDEMFFQTMVGHLVPHNKITNHGLTFYKFTDYGKPIVFYDDHHDYPFGLNRFFYRKISSEAKTLIKRSLQTALKKSEINSNLEINEKNNNDFELKKRAQIWFPRPGAIYYKSQYEETYGESLHTCKKPYVVLFGRRKDIAIITKRIKGESLYSVGRVFSKNMVFEDANFDELNGLSKNDIFIRDMDQFLYLTRVKARVQGVPVISWVPGDHKWPLAKIFNDPNALKILISPNSTNKDEWIRSFKIDSLKEVDSSNYMPNIEPENLYKAKLTMVEDNLVPNQLLQIYDGNISRDIILCPSVVDAENTKMVDRFGFLMDKSEVDSEILMRKTQKDFVKSVVSNSFNEHEWFDELIHSIYGFKG